MPDSLSHSEAETNRLLNECTLEQQRLQNRLGQYQGRMANLGTRGELQKQLDQKKKRIAKLEETYAALTIAQDTLAEARAELQRRFAPRITRRAQKLLSAMTGGRYHSVTMSDDFSLRAGAGEEEVLRDAIWRSDGTMDQLYLAPTVRGTRSTPQSRPTRHRHLRAPQREHRPHSRPQSRCRQYVQ